MNLKADMIVGVDFDNTLVNYDDAFFQRALELGLIAPSQDRHKSQLRDQIRLLPDGETVWQQLQSYVYTQGMSKACLIAGVKDFFIFCRQRQIRVYIISHKTQHAPFAPAEMNLRRITLTWMQANSFFQPEGMRLDLTQVYFESSRADKIGRIKMLGCTHFIDDLQEVFLEKDFPVDVEKILYAPSPDLLKAENITVLDSWEKINEHLFNRA